MPIFTAAATCFEIPGSLQEGMDENGPTASVRLYCAFVDRWVIINDLLINARVWPYIIGTTFPVIARAASVVPQIEKTTTTGQTFDWLNCEIDVQYGVPKLEDRVTLAEEIVPSAQFITLDPHGYRWGSANGDPLKDEEAPGFQDVTAIWRLTRYRLPNIPAYLDSLYGKCNNATLVPVTLTGYSFAAERVILASWKANRSVNLLLAGASDKWDVTTELAIKRNSWNQYLRGKEGTYQDLYVQGGTRFTPYPLADFSPVVLP